MLQNRQTRSHYREIISWLQNSSVKMLSSEQYRALGELAQLLEEVGVTDNNSLQTLIEVHHDGSGLVDFSVYCDQMSSDLEKIIQPEWMQQWLSQVRLSDLYHAFPKRYWLEFDFHDLGYRLMGLFQRCEPGALDLTILLELLRAKVGTDGFFSSIVENLGMPIQLGLINRTDKIIKVVIPLQESFQEHLINLVSNWFAPQLKNSELSADSLAEALGQWKDIGGVNISIDCNLYQDKPGPRLCFELFDKDVLCTHRRRSLMHNLLERFHVPPHQISQSRSLRNQLPYAIRRPQFNLVSQEYLYLIPSHRKICIDSDSVILKDYICLGIGSA